MKTLTTPFEKFGYYVSLFLTFFPVLLFIVILVCHCSGMI